MSYVRVIPRDLFNEGNLLKCYGQLYLGLEKLGMQDCLVHDTQSLSLPFEVFQDQADGSTFLDNVWLHLYPRRIKLRRPLNSREPFPLYAEFDEDEGPIRVFTDDGTFTPEFKRQLLNE